MRRDRQMAQRSGLRQARSEHRPPRYRTRHADVDRAGDARLCRTPLRSDHRRRLCAGADHGERRERLSEHSFRHRRRCQRVAQRRLAGFQGARRLVPGRPARGQGFQDRDSRLSRRDGHRAHPSLREGLRRGRPLGESEHPHHPELRRRHRHRLEQSRERARSSRSRKSARARMSSSRRRAIPASAPSTRSSRRAPSTAARRIL